MAQKVLAIDIGNELIKIAEVSTSGKNNIYIHNVLLTETPEFSYEDGILRDKEKLARAINAAIIQQEINNNLVMFSMSSTKIVSREVILPDCKEKKLKDIINANVAEYFPVNISEYIISYTLIQKFETEEGKQQRVLVIAAPVGMVKSYYELAKMMGKQVISLDYAGNSIFQLFKNEAKEGITLVVQLGSQTTGIQIVQNRVLELQRTLNYGISGTVIAAMDKFNMLEEEARALLKEKTFIIDTDDSKADEDITQSMFTIVNSINRILDYFQTRNQNAHITQIYLVGGGALVKGIDKYFEQQFEVPASIKNSFQNVILDKRIAGSNIDPVFFITNMGGMIAPVGFALPEFAENQNKKNLIGLAVGFAVICLVASIGIVAYPFILNQTYKNNKEELQHKIAQIESVETYVQERDKVVAEKNLYETAYVSTVATNEKTADLITELEDKIPTDVIFTNLQVTEVNVLMSGTAKSLDSVAKLIQQLKSIKYLSEVDIPSISEDKNDLGTKYSFSVTCTFQ